MEGVVGGCVIGGSAEDADSGCVIGVEGVVGGCVMGGSVGGLVGGCVMGGSVGVVVGGDVEDVKGGCMEGVG